MARLTNNTEIQFVLLFKQRLQPGFTFTEFGVRENKEFQKFLNIIENMTVDQVNKQYGCQPDSKDIFNGHQVYHYAITRKIRIHGIFEDGLFHVLRLDPNHKIHEK